MPYTAMTSRLYVLFCVLILSCTKEENATPDEALSTWKLAEVYIDPGDGSGTFVPADYDREISLYRDSIYRASARLCGINNVRGRAIQGNYSPSQNIFFSPECNMQTEYGYTLTDLEMIVFFFCDKGCAERYVRVWN